MKRKGIDDAGSGQGQALGRKGGGRDLDGLTEGEQYKVSKVDVSGGPSGFHH